jgi:prepilin-type N-terminal cleavage/methylation domain-containing protein
MKKNKQGFTLIELLVVIAIIGLLATLSIVALNTARARARDAKRVADIKQIQTAVELFFNDNGYYPAAVTAGDQIASGTNVYMGVVPSAPLPPDGTACTALNNVYTYTQDTVNGTAGASYHIAYCIGMATGNISAGVGTATPASIK